METGQDLSVGISKFASSGISVQIILDSFRSDIFLIGDCRADNHRIAVTALESVHHM
jgi:hypothetical protein